MWNTIIHVVRSIRIKHVAIFLCICFAVWFVFSLPKPLFEEKYASVIEDRNGKFLSAQIAPDFQWRFPANDSVIFKFAECIRLFEDEYFYRHPGINPISVLRAAKQNITAKRIVSGGSTLSMQVIRLARKNKRRTFGEKILEYILALRLELSYSKQEILGLYAAHAPFGGNVVGIEAASWRYYNRPSYMLSWGEAATLAVLPNAPALVFPGKNHIVLEKKRNALLDKLVSRGIIDATTSLLAKTEPLPQKPNALPHLAPHLLQRMIRDGYAGKNMQTTIDYRTQQFALNMANKYAKKYNANHVHNVAILILDTKTGEVLAYVGNVSKEFSNSQFYVDIIGAPRSSGSILKPLLYAAMLTEGAILPTSLIDDIPTRIGDYAPENFEKTFEGVVHAHDALARSLNIPAVRMLQSFGIDKGLHYLQLSGFSTINKPADYYGLSLILGGAEVSLWESTAVYASMARSLMYFTENSSQYSSEDYRKPQYLYGVTHNIQNQSHSVFDAGAIYATMEALSMVNRPWGEIGWEHFASAHKIAWKTGTSFGHRDAWSIGVTPQYTVGVWVGNANGEGRPGLTGLTYAAPLMFEMFRYLGAGAWFSLPYDDMVSIEICNKSGMRATELCDVDTVYVPKNGVRVEACKYHQLVFLDSTRTYRVAASCYPVRYMHKESRFVLPPTQEWFYKKTHPHYQSLPAWLKQCSNYSCNPIDVLHPQNNSSIKIPKGIDGEQGKVIFELVHQQAQTTVYWHIDDAYITSTNYEHKVELFLSEGVHVLTVVDEQGNSVQRKFSIVR